MPFQAQERALIQRCLEQQPGAWREFVNRYVGLIYHVIHHTSYLRSMPLQPEDVEDLAAEILFQIVAQDYQVLRHFKGRSSFSTYLTVVSRRICVHELVRRASKRDMISHANEEAMIAEAQSKERPEAAIENLEEVDKLLSKLPAREREVVRLNYVEGRSYEEISSELHLPVNSIGPILTRARKRLAEGVKSPPPKRKLHSAK